MVEEKDFVLVSIPFVAGIALMQAWSPCGVALYTSASASNFLSILLLFFVWKRRRVYFLAPALFFLLGIFCWCTSSLYPQPAVRHAAPWLSSIVDGCGLNDTVSALLKALLSGDRGSLDREVATHFRDAGASHILALSGLHLGVIYALLNRMLFALGNGRLVMIARSVICVAVCAVYVNATGMSDSIIRAFIFICMNELWKHFPGRRRRPESLFCLALTVHLLIKPHAIGQIGFQLSYMAMLGIILVFPHIKALYPEHSRFSLTGRIWDGAALAISCQLFTAPVVYRTFHTFPQNFLITNIIVMPLAEALIVCGALCCMGNSVGFCPEILKSLTENLGQAVLFCVKVIATLS